MRSIFKCFSFLVLCFISATSFAGKDPISWTLSGGFPDIVLAGRSYTITYTFTNELPLQLVKPLNIEKNANPASDFSYVDNCSGVRLNSHASCTVAVTLVPSDQATKTVQLTIGGYDDNRVPVPPASTGSIGNNPALTPVTVVGQMSPTLTVGTPDNYTFTYNNNGETDVSIVSVNVSQSSGTPNFTTNCVTSLPARTGTCNVTGSYTPNDATPVTQSVTSTMTYSGTKTVAATVSGTVSSVAGVIPSFTGNNKFPAEMVGGDTQQLQVQFLNNTGAEIQPSSVSLIATPAGPNSGGTASFTVDAPGSATNNCMNGNLSNGAACIITGHFVANTVVSDSQVTVAADLQYKVPPFSGPDLASTIGGSTYVVPSVTTDRTITLKNSCDFPIWVSFSGGGQGACPCPTGQTCGPANTCYWNNPAITGGNLFNPGDSRTATVTDYGTATNPTLQWSGTISASLRCDTGGCLMAPCHNASGTTNCENGKGFEGPATLAEITFGLNTTDNYDVSVINGFHIPVAIIPGSHTIPNNYVCGVAGNYTAENNFGSCNWETATTPNNAYYVVTPGGQACNVATPSCPANQVCGIASGSIPGAITESCGAFLGYWTASEICGSLKPVKGSSLDTLFGCNNPLPAEYAPYVVSGESNTYTALMLCAVPSHDPAPVFNSCYNPYSPSYNSLLPLCCGCVDWWNTIPGVNSHTAQSCNGVTNSTWNQNMQLQLTWIKTACPSSYVYQFDDKTSGYSCSTNATPQPNYTNYTVEFCQGNTGKTQTLGNTVYDGRKNPPAPLQHHRKKA